MIELKSRWGPVIAETTNRNRLIDICWQWMRRQGFTFNEFVSADHIAWDPDENQYTLILYKRLITLRADSATEEELVDDGEEGNNPLLSN